LNDVQEFIKLLKEKGWIGIPDYEEIIRNDVDILTKLVQEGMQL